MTQADIAACNDLFRFRGEQSQKLNFTMDGLHAASQALERIDNTMRRLQHTPAAESSTASPSSTFLPVAKLRP